MADQPVTREKLINADKDVQTIEDFIKKPKDETVTTRFGDKIMTLKGLEEEVKKSGGYFKRYTTLAAANADIANIPVDAVVKVTSETDGGDYYKAAADATSLTKSPYDSLVQAKMDATAKANAAKSEAIEVSSEYSDLTKADKALAADPNVAIALTFKDGDRTWLEAGYDGGPTTHAKEVLNSSLDGVGKALAADPNVAIALTFKDGERTWLEAGYDGGPTERSIDILQRHFSQGSSDFKVSDRFVSLSTQGIGASSISREYPVFRRASGPLITHSQQSSETIYWTWMVNKEMWGGTGLALFYSTDHAAHDPSGVFLFESDSIEGPWIDRGKVYRDDILGNQTETPSVIYDPVTNKVLMFYQQAGVTGSIGGQQTCLATADPNNLTTWTRVGVVLDKESAAQDGDGHCGYFRPFFYCGELLGYSLYGGTNWSNAALWRSKDGGYTWKRDGSMIGWMQDKCKHLASVLNTTQNLCVLTMYEGDVINWRGQPWWIGVVGVAQSGSVGTRNSRLVAAPLSDDFTSLKTKVVDITPPKAAYEAVNGIDYPGNLFVWDGEVYSAYRTNGQKGAIALMKMING
ncbi:hypothetical protein [Acinetobacter lwoffii]|uniref:hypothetical protein n=1 Tax=Acinetobacter lwoffii TaxID=28090 RepID=UPI00168D0787|nr:hypothetical protein [Acinetobacter lwoffii]